MADPAPRLEQHVDRLDEEDVRKFAQAYERLTSVLAERRAALEEQSCSSA